MNKGEGHGKEPTVGIVQLRLDQRTLDRIQALAMLQQETLPGMPYDHDDAAHQALDRGLDLMISELLVHRAVRSFPVQRGPAGRTDT
jgi:hypothetical protein